MSKQSERWLVEFTLHIAAERQDGHDFNTLLASLDEESADNYTYTGIADLTGAVMELSTIAIGLHRLAEAACNSELTSRQVKREQDLESRAAGLVHGFGAGFEAVLGSGDPRGAPLYVKMPSGYSDSWAGKGLVVPY